LSDPRQYLETRLVLGHELAQEFDVEPVHVVERVDEGIAAADPEEEPDFAEARLEVHDDVRSPDRRASSTAQFHRDSGRTGAALGAEEHQRRRRAGMPGRGAARGSPADRFVEGLLRRRVGEELVRAGRASTAG
jgi:hypothetical protein